MSEARDADGEAIDRVLAGDREAFGVLVDRHGARLHGAILRMVGDAEAANDLSQETLLRAYRALGRFRRGSAFFTWLYAIARNQVLSEFRRRRSTKGQAMLYRWRLFVHALAIALCMVGLACSAPLKTAGHVAAWNILWP